jgi:hypothetical protein
MYNTPEKLVLKKKPIVRLFVSNIAKFESKVNVRPGIADAGRTPNPEKVDERKLVGTWMDFHGFPFPLILQHSE